MLGDNAEKNHRQHDGTEHNQLISSAGCLHGHLGC
jgi:hypothetical protein